MKDITKFINKGSMIYVSIFLIFLINFISIPNSFSTTNDIWVHTATINELSENFTSPQDFFYGSEYSGDRYRPYYFIWALLKKVFNLDIFFVIFLASIVNLFILFAGIYYFTKEYFKDKIIPVYALLIMVFFWGFGISHSNEYSFRMLIIASSYPSTFAFACSLIVFYFILKYLRTDNIYYYIVSIPIGVMIFLSHPFTGSFLFLNVAVMMFSEKTAMRNKILLFSFPSIVLLIALFWPYFSWYDVIFTPVSKTVSLSDEGQHVPVFYSLSGLLNVSLVLFAGTVILFKFFLNKEYKKKYKFIYYGAVSFILIYIIFGIFTITYGGRYLYFYIFFLHLAIATEFRRRNLFSLNKLKRMINVVSQKKYLDIALLSLFLLSVVIQIGYSYAPHFVSKEDGKLTVHGYVPYKYHIDFNEYKFLENEVSHYDVILSDPETSLYIPTHSGKVIYAARDSSGQIFKKDLMKDKDEFSDTNERYKDVVFFFQQDTTKEVRKNVIDKYNISYVLINHNLNLFNKRTINEIENMGNVTYRSEYFTLVKVR